MERLADENLKFIHLEFKEGHLYSRVRVPTQKRLKNPKAHVDRFADENLKYVVVGKL